MKLDRFSLSVFAIFFALNFTFIYAQNLQSSPNISLEKSKSSSFKEDKTVVAEVKFEGLDSDFENYSSPIGNSVYESEFLSILRETKTEISADEKFNSRKTEQIIKFLKEWLANKGYLKADVVALGEKLPKNRMNLVFSVRRNAPVRVLAINFSGNVRFAGEELGEVIKKCLKESWITFDKGHYEYCAKKDVRNFMFGSGYFQSKINSITTRVVADNFIVNVDIAEGLRYRFGKMEVVGAKVFTEKEILEMSEVKTGDIADGKSLMDFFNEKLKKLYADKGYILYNAEFDVGFINSLAEGLDGIVNIKGTIDEGKQFKIGKIEFTGIEQEKTQKLKQILDLNEGEIYNESKFKDGIRKINETKDFQFVDDEKDVELLVSEQNDDLNLVIRVKKIN